MNKFFLATAFAAFAIGGIHAQVENLALSFTPSGKVDCGGMPNLNNLTSYSLQFWINPSTWTNNASIISRGSDFSVKLTDQNGIQFNNGANSVSAKSEDLKHGEWNQITMICNEGNAVILINGKEAGSGFLSELQKSDGNFILGGDYTGLIDEVRVWDDALNDTMALFDYFINNTLNKWNPMWENLVVYYKMDQKDCPYLVDYKGIESDLKDYDNHGVLSDGVIKVIADNNKMPYLINAAYTNNERFYDRIIPRDQFLLSNEIIILGVNDYESDGHLEVKMPNNHATSLKNAEYIAQFEEREGVISLSGDSFIELPPASFPTESSYTFESWLYIDKWIPGAYILRKENEDRTKGIAIYLGDDDEHRVLVRINGKVYCSTKSLNLPVGEWVYFGVYQGSGTYASETVVFQKNTRRFETDPDTPLTTGEAGIKNAQLSAESAEFPVMIGEKFQGKFDDLIIWNKSYSSSDVSKHRTAIPMPGLNNTVAGADIISSCGFYRFNDPENLGHSYHSQDEWLNIMKSAFDGHSGVNFVLSVMGSYTPSQPYGDWRNIVMNSGKRERFASDLAELSKNYDGVELDLEWIEDNLLWQRYGLLAQEIREKLPEGKTFRISLHNYYTNFPADCMQYVDGFTFQQYGPQATNFGYQNFQTNVDNFIKKFDRNKIMTSYSTTTSKGEGGSAVTGVKGAILESYEINDNDVDKYTGNDTWSYMGPMQVYKRAKYTRENNLQGIFYWDMGNDYWLGTAANPIMPEYNQAKYCSYAINANNDTIVTNLNINHYGETNSITKVEKETDLIKLSVSPSPAENQINVSLSNGEFPEEVLIYSLSGALMIENKKKNIIDVNNLISGIYLIEVKDRYGSRYKTKFIKR